jgi:hypothetical protein
VARLGNNGSKSLALLSGVLENKVPEVKLSKLQQPLTLFGLPTLHFLPEF